MTCLHKYQLNCLLSYVFFRLRLYFCEVDTIRACDSHCLLWITARSAKRIKIGRSVGEPAVESSSSFSSSKILSRASSTLARMHFLNSFIDFVSAKSSLHLDSSKIKSLMISLPSSFASSGRESSPKKPRILAVACVMRSSMVVSFVISGISNCGTCTSTKFGQSTINFFNFQLYLLKTLLKWLEHKALNEKNQQNTSKHCFNLKARQRLENVSRLGV